MPQDKTHTQQMNPWNTKPIEEIVHAYLSNGFNTTTKRLARAALIAKKYEPDLILDKYHKFITKMSIQW